MARIVIMTNSVLQGGAVNHFKLDPGNSDKIRTSKPIMAV